MKPPPPIAGRPNNAPHAHAALQLAFGLAGGVSVDLGGGQTLVAEALLIGPGVRHRLLGDGTVGLVYVEPQTPLGAGWLSLLDGRDAIATPPTLMRGVDTGAGPDAWIAELGAAASTAPSPTPNPRLLGVLDELAARPGLPIAAAGEAAGLSETHLRALARRHLGFPLSTWLLWRKLERAAREMAAGASLAGAAAAGGFADQAHYARTMRRMFGVTPAMARVALT
ncbi:MAG: helix-turn-helix domain-containing protein [Pseudomonadota bacterium]